MKKVLALSIVLGLMISFVGCGNSSQSNDSTGENQSSSSTVTSEKKDGEVEVLENEVIRYYSSEEAYGKATWTFDDNEKITGLNLELNSKNGSSLEQVKVDHSNEGFEVVEFTGTTLKMKAGKKLLENENEKHKSKNDLVTTLESQENQ